MLIKALDIFGLDRLLLAALAGVFAGVALLLNWLLGEYFNLYLSTELGLVYWIDVFPHFCGGVACGFAGVITLSLWKGFRLRHYYVVILALTILVGVGWELYEIRLGMLEVEGQFSFPGYDHHLFNVVKDMLVNCLGALSAGRISKTFIGVED